MIKKRSLFSVLNNHVIDYPTLVNINYFWSLGAFNECQRNVGLNAPIKEEFSTSVSGSKTVFSTNEFSLLDFIDLSNFYTYFGLYMGFIFFLFQLYIFLCMGKSFFIGEVFKSYFCCIRDIKLDFHLFFMLIFGGLLSIALVFSFCILNDYVNFLQEHINYNFKYHVLNKESLDLIKEEVNFLKNVQLIDHGRPPELSCAAGKCLIKDNDGVL